MSVEKSSGDTHDASSAPATGQGSGAETGDEHAGESGEAAESGEPAEGHAEPGAGEASEEDATLLGIDLEATGFVALAAAVSVALALARVAAPRLGVVARGGGRRDGRLRRA